MTQPPKIQIHYENPKSGEIPTLSLFKLHHLFHLLTPNPQLQLLTWYPIWGSFDLTSKSVHNTNLCRNPTLIVKNMIFDLACKSTIDVLYKPLFWLPKVYYLTKPMFTRCVIYDDIYPCVKLLNKNIHIFYSAIQKKVAHFILSYLVGHLSFTQKSKVGNCLLSI